MGTVGHFIPSIRYVLHLLGWILILFLQCYYGQKVIDESIGVATDIYATPWYTSSVKVQKDILLILTRAQKPLTLRAMKFGTMSAQTFLSVIPLSYLYKLCDRNCSTLQLVITNENYLITSILNLVPQTFN
ncbi:putative odorant receptor [Trypoxylus dichotomus]